MYLFIDKQSCPISYIFAKSLCKSDFYVVKYVQKLLHNTEIFDTIVY